MHKACSGSQYCSNVAARNDCGVIGMGSRYITERDSHLFDFVHDLVDCLQQERFGRVLAHRLQLDCETA
jgi:hypothetical protein